MRQINQITWSIIALIAAISIFGVAVITANLDVSTRTLFIVVGLLVVIVPLINVSNKLETMGDEERSRQSKGLLLGSMEFVTYALLVMAGIQSVLPHMANASIMLMQAAGGIAFVGMAYLIYKLYTRPAPVVVSVKEETLPAQPPVPIPASFMFSHHDLDRVLHYQAARILMYATTNYRQDDYFHAAIDTNARTASLFHSEDTILDENILLWRMCVLMAGPAAERMLRPTSNNTILAVNSELAIDDMVEFDTCLRKALFLKTGLKAYTNPATPSEATMVEANMAATRRKFVVKVSHFISTNREPLKHIIKLLKSNSAINGEDLEPILANVNRCAMPSVTFNVCIKENLFNDPLSAGDDTINETTTLSQLIAVSRPSLGSKVVPIKNEA